MHERRDANGGGASKRSIDLSRRSVLKATGAGAASVGGGTAVGLLGSGAAVGAAFDRLSISDDNRIVDESGETVVLRGLGVPDPKRLAITKRLRGKGPLQVVDLLTDAEAGWHPTAIRLPASPVDIGEHPNGDTGPRYGIDSPYEIPDDRRRRRPPQPPAFDRSDLESYVEDYYDPVVQRCKERGVYCIVDFHRHWHEQPPSDGEGNGGPEGPMEAENHLPYDSPHTNYWAKNTYWGDGESIPASFGYVDQRFRNEYTAATSDDYVPEDVVEHPYKEEHWEVNEPLVDEAVEFWTYVADYFADEPHVLFEPYDEPVAPGLPGPENGCGHWKQQGLWQVFLEDFARPILDAIEERAPGSLSTMSVPGRCTATQALHWDDFGAIGHGDVAVTWHNGPRDEVSASENWLNDTDYAYRELSDPWHDSPPADRHSSQCYGWERYEAQGLQNAMEFHPVVVSEFGWWDFTQVERWTVTPPKPNEGTTAGYGRHFLDAIEADDRISWIACWADVRRRPMAFDVDFEVTEEDIDLVDGSFYHPDSDVPVNCPSPPCEWTLTENPDMGQHVKDRLAAAHEATETVTTTETTTTPETAMATETPTTTETVSGTPGRVADDSALPHDPDADGLYEDVNGNGRQDIADAVDLFQNRESVDPAFFDFNDSGGMEIGDAVELFRENTG